LAKNISAKLNPTVRTRNLFVKAIEVEVNAWADALFGKASTACAPLWEPTTTLSVSTFGPPIMTDAGFINPFTYLTYKVTADAH